MMKMTVSNVKVKVSAQYHRAGSVLAGTAKAGCDSVSTELSLDCDDTADRIADLIRAAEASCYTIGALREPTPCELVAVVNQQPFAIDLS